MTQRSKARLAAVGAVLVVTGAIWLAAKIVPSWRTPTFSRDIAPLVASNCTTCHRQGGAGPFPLRTYAQVKRRARQIVDVTSSHFMPPWLPAAQPPGSEFLHPRRLSDRQISSLRRWLEAGTPEGKPRALPPLPVASDEWPLGSPDLVVAMPEPYELPAEGRDVYRNFVVPIPLDAPRFVRAIDLRPGDPKLVHHAFLQLDRSGEGQLADEREAGVGFSGMNSVGGATSPPGHFLSWQPGKLPAPEIDGTQWQLRPGTDAVFQLHMRPTGKPEHVQARVGLYFTDQPPDKFPVRILLRSTAIDIPAGDAEYVIESAYQLPVPVAIVAVLPHAHYLGRDLQGWAELPDGSRKTIIHIPQWDFNWQGDYQFARPLDLPAGTTLRMRYTFDNSARNPYSPDPPRRVQFGEQTSDEMGELWLQVLAQNASDALQLERDYVQKYSIPDALALNELTLERDPDNVPVRTNYAGVLFQAGRIEEAERELRRVLEIAPDHALAHSHLAHIHLRQGNLSRAKSELRTAIALNPKDYKSENNLGIILLRQGDPAGAIVHFRRGLALNPDDEMARGNLAKAQAALRRGLAD